MYDINYKEFKEIEKQILLKKVTAWTEETLTDDIAVLKTNISRLERELEVALNGELSTYDELLKYVMELQSELMEYQKENEELYNIANKAMDIAESENEKYIKLTQHIRLKAENNPGVSRYIDLVNYIDRLEKGEK